MEEILRELSDSIGGLSQIKDGKTFFELSPIEDEEVCKAWDRLNAAQKHVTELLSKISREPKGYLAWHTWAEKKNKTHKQVKCEDCGFYTKWVKKNPTHTQEKV